MRTLGKSAGRFSATLIVAVLLSGAAIGPAAAGPKRDAALQDCKNIYDEQQKHCIGSSNYAACMTMITEKYESCRAEADTVVGLNVGQPKLPRATTYRLAPLATAVQQ